MENEKIKSGLLVLEQNIVALIKNYNRLKKEISILKLEYEKIKLELKTKNEELDNFKNRINITKIAEGIDLKNQDVAKLRKTIDGYVVDIDKCINHLIK